MSNWTQPSGTVLVTTNEEETISLGLPLVASPDSLKIIAGSLPPGLRIYQNNIIGTPLQVERTTSFRFVLRSTLSNDVEDRTYKIVVSGADEPVWKTKEGRLPIGNSPLNNRYFILDNEIIDFQLVATDVDLPEGKSLEFWIDKGDGILPPGISMSKTGKISGVVEPLLALDKKSKVGEYDTGNYDMYLHDFSNKSTLFFQGQLLSNYVYNPPKKLNRYYEFKVSVSDGIDVVKRNFIIYVVGEDFLRADNVVVQVATGVFTADNTYIRTPVWITPKDFGFRRASNYITLFLEVLKNENQQGAIRYKLMPLNDDGTNSVIPDGMTIDINTGEVAGRVAYQPIITKEYKFTVRAELVLSDNNVISVATFKDKTFTVTLLGQVDSTIAWTSDAKLGSIPANQISVFKVQGTTTVPDAPLFYTLSSGRLPPGLTLQYNGEITGTVVQFGNSEKDGLTFFDNDDMTFDNDTTSIDRTYTFTVEAKDRFGFSATTKKFTINVIDDDDRQYSNLFMKPYLKETKRNAYQEFISNPANFPPTSIYRPNDPNFGIQRDVKILAYAGIETKTIDEFSIASQKWHRKRRFNIGSLKSAVAKTPGTQNVVYEVIYVELIDPAKAKTGETKKSFVQQGSMQLKADLAQRSNHKQGTPTLLDSNGVNRNDERYIFTGDDTQLDLGDEVLRPVVTETDYVQGPLIAENNGTVFDRSLTVNGLKLVVAGEVGGAPRVPDEWAKKTARVVDLITDPNGSGINTTHQRNFIKTLKGDTGTKHAGIPTVQRIGYGGGSSYTPNWLEDANIASYAGLQAFNNSVAQKDMVWYRNTNGNNPPTQRRDIEEIMEHVFHTIHAFGIPGAVPGSSDAVEMNPDIRIGNEPSFDWQNTALHLAMKQAIDNGQYDPSGYSTDWATDPEAAAVAYTEYTYLLNWSMWEMSEFWENGSLSPEWADDMRTPAGLLANNPLGYALFNTYFAPVLSKPDFAVLRTIFGEGDTGVSGYIVNQGLDTLTATANTDTDPFIFGEHNVVKADSDAVLASGGQGKKYISNITNMQDSIKALGRTEYDFLPLWMRTPQVAGEQETGFILAIPLCYCKPGTSNEIMINLRNRTYDFKDLDIEIDRYIVDSVVGDSNDQYIVFGKYNYNA